MRARILPAAEATSVSLALKELQAGNVIAIPTDTVYGVAADGFNIDAIDRLFAVKDRPRDKPIPLLLAEPSDLALVAVDLPKAAELLAERLWPGGLTLVVKANVQVPGILRAEGNSVAVRVPDHPVPRNLARLLRRPLAATSANLSGGSNPSTALDVDIQLRGRIGLILDGGQVGMGLASTVVDLTVIPPRILRLGAQTLDQIESLLGIRLASDAYRD